MVAAHRDGRGSGVETAGRTRAQSDEERQAVAGDDPVSPKARNSAVAVGEGMDLGPLSVGDGCDPEGGVQFRNRCWRGPRGGQPGPGRPGGGEPPPRGGAPPSPAPVGGGPGGVVAGPGPGGGEPPPARKVPTPAGTSADKTPRTPP